jgi:hypothetical protein
MAKNYMERIFGVGAFERQIPGTGPGEEASVRYVSFDDPASIPKLFHEVLNKIKPKLVKDGGQSSKARNWNSLMAVVFLRYFLALNSRDGANKLSSAPQSSAELPRKCEAVA